MLPLLSDVFRVRHGSRAEAWLPERGMAGDETRCEMSSLAQGWRGQRSVVLFLYLLRNFKLFAEAEFFRFEVIHAHDFFDADFVFAGDFPKAVARLHGVELFLGLRGDWFGWGHRERGLGNGWLGGFGSDEVREEAAEGGVVLVGLGEGLCGEGVEEGGGAFADGVGTGGGEELFGEVFEGFIGVEIEEGEDLGVVEALGDEVEIGLEEDFGGDFGMMREGVEEEEASAVGSEIEGKALLLGEGREGFPLPFADELDDLFAGNRDVCLGQEGGDGVVFGREIESIEE